MMNNADYRQKLKEFAREKRNNSTFGEILLWKKLLSKRKLGYQFNRQFPIENYIVDFISRNLKLIIEVDGYSHEFTQDKDELRDTRLKTLGYTVLRFRERDVKYDFDNVCNAIVVYIRDFEKENHIAHDQSP
ncbi:MAG: endonuclease domain-containing protein [Bacteroidia bacterium]